MKSTSLEENPLARLLAAVRAMSGRLIAFPSRAADAELAKLLWLIRLRWLAITACLILCAPALAAGYLSRDSVPTYLGLVGVVIIFNLFTQLLTANFKEGPHPLWICFQMIFDLGMLTAMLRLTGGMANPLFSLFLLNSTLGALLLTSRLSWSFLLLSLSFLAFLQFHSLTANPGSATSGQAAYFAVAHLLVFTFWLVMRSVGAHLDRQSARQAQAQVILEKQDRLRAIGALAAGFSHEFASPLNTAKLRLERLARSNASEDVREALAAVRACEAVVRQMNSSQIDRRDFQFKAVALADLLTDVVDSWREENPDAEVNLWITEAATAHLPPVNFAQVILNLLDNAAEAAPGKEIDVALEGSATHFHLKVSDGGPGFSEIVKNRLGEPFVTTKPSGTGLGLYVSQLFCQSLGGNLTLKNNEPGATVQLEWPKSGSAS